MAATPASAKAPRCSACTSETRLITIPRCNARDTHSARWTPRTREPQTKRVERPRGQEEHTGGSDHKSPSEAPAELAGGQVAHPGARIARVDLGIDQAIECHRGRAGAHHRDDDPQQRSPQVRRVK